MRKLHLLLFTLFVSGCATIGIYEFDKRFGHSDHNNRQINQITQSQKQHFSEVIKPIIDNRCVVCHGCFDAPCQLKLETPLGLERGASKVKVYDGSRLSTIKPTGFIENNSNIDYWRAEGFFPVLNERSQTKAANLEASVFYQMLALKKAHPLPDTPLLDESFDLGLDRRQQCPTIEEFQRYQQKTPLAGMPYGLPGLDDSEHNLLTDWLAQGAYNYIDNQLTVDEQLMVDRWEAFLNNDNLKNQLVARYLYEHLYLANLYFDENAHRYFTLVRSRTPVGQPIEPIISRRPYDEPNVDRVYYRLTLNTNTVIAKRHMPYRFDNDKLTRYQELFMMPNYQVTQLPSYEIESASNPFKTFKDLPVKSRYQFLLDEAQFTIMNFIKGPVCRGQIALNVINDHFWVFFTDPENIELYHIDQFLATQTDHLTLPAATSDGLLSILNWHDYAKRQQAYLNDRQAYILSLEDTPKNDLDLDLIWQGNGNPNAALTIFRHFDSASVLKGPIGDNPKTTWVIDYPLMERIHYLLVAGFDVYGDVSHQLKTRLYMDFLRLEGESNFIALLPKKDRKPTFESWYQNTNNAISGYSYGNESAEIPQSNINYQTANTKIELQTLLSQHVSQSITDKVSITDDIKTQPLLAKLAKMKGKTLTLLPQTSILRVHGNNNSSYYTLIKNSSHSNVAHLFLEDKRRVPERDTLTVAKGIVGTYPNAFFDVSDQQLAQFVDSLHNMTNNSDYQRLKDNFAIRRTDNNFWQYADQLHTWYQKHQPLDYGLLDFNRLENK
ncbi:fatty acid cis/trans isomerase [Thalassotalea sp. PLHSN55]|uniref:fatty acid cis/trans isomerase n=1 Tax=Thalassotalea sp. PLHSN55 TaxID=3435888 RepID=UPI003F843426